jgi:hypothetical protein
MSKVEYVITEAVTAYGYIPEPMPPPEGNWKLLGPPAVFGPSTNPRFIFYWESIPEKKEEVSADEVVATTAKLVSAIRFGINHIIKRVEEAPSPERAKGDAIAGLRGLLTAIDKMLQVGT